MKYNFDSIIRRRNTDCMKWDRDVNDYGEDVIPMWVADMDFPCFDEAYDAILKRAQHPVYGYTFVKDDVRELIVERIKKNFSWEIKKEWIVFIPGVVDGIASSVQILSEKGEGVLIQEPVYHPFNKVINALERKKFSNELEIVNNNYKMNMKELKEIAEGHKVKTAVLCNPHNPVGRVWDKAELEEFGNTCIDNGITVISDEIHSDIIYSGYKHTCFGAISKKFEENSIVLMAPSKTFNVAGLCQAYAIIANEELRGKFQSIREGMNWGNVFGITALEACYKYGNEYQKQLINYLENNILYIEKFIKEKLPMLNVFKPQGTYLMWLDMRNLNLTQEELTELIVNKAKLKFNDGMKFGKCGQGFMRMNIGCPKAYIEEAMYRLEKAINN